RRAHGKGAPTSRRLVHQVRRQRGGAHQRAAEPARHPHLRSRSPRAAREEVHEDHFACPGGALVVLGLKVKKGEQVEILSGKDRGKRGRVVRVWPKNAKVLVEGVNFVKRHEKVRAATGRAGTQGGIITK